MNELFNIVLKHDAQVSFSKDKVILDVVYNSRLYRFGALIEIGGPIGHKDIKNALQLCINQFKRAKNEL